MTNLELRQFMAEHDLDVRFYDYLEYLNLRDEAAKLRIKSKISPHPYFQNHPSTQNRRYMDRESQYFIRARLMYSGKYPITDALFHLIFRKYSTYEQVKNHFNDFPGNLVYRGHNLDDVIGYVNKLKTPFTGAYLVPHRAKLFKTKVEGWLRLFDAYDFEKLVGECTTAKECFEKLKSINGVGDFLAMQFTTELSWLNETKFGCNEFVIPGNGAVRGLNKLGVPKKNHVAFLHALMELQPLKHPAWLPMTLMDYQNTFCEFDKFTRYMGGYEDQGRTKMKRLRKIKDTPITVFVTTDKLQALKQQIQ